MATLLASMMRPLALATAAGAAIVLFIALSAPWLLGLHAEQLYRAGVRKLSSAGYPVVENRYQRGWFQSKALLLIAAPETTAPEWLREPEPVQLQIASRILHGPRGEALWRWPPVLALARGRAAAVNARRRLPPLIAEAAFEIGGAVTVDLRLPAISYSGNAGSLHLVDAQGRLRLVDDERGWSGHGRLPLLEAVDLDGRSLVVRGLSWRFELRNLLGGIPVGEVVFVLEGLQLDASARQPPLQAAGLSLHLEMAADMGTAGAKMQTRIDRLRIDRSDFAPSELRLTVAGLDVLSLQGLLDSLRRLRARNLPESVRGLAIGQLLTQALPGLAAAEPHMRLEKLEMATPNGAVTATGHLGLSAETSAGRPGVKPGLGWRHLLGEARISAPRDLVLQLLVNQQRRRVQRELSLRGSPSAPLPAKLAQEIEAAARASVRTLLHDGWLSAERGRLTAMAVLSDGRLTLNGKRVPFNSWHP